MAAISPITNFPQSGMQQTDFQAAYDGFFPQLNLAISQMNAFANLFPLWLGVKSAAPTLQNDGTALVAGNQYLLTSNNTVYVWSGSAWVESGMGNAQLAALAGLASAANKLPYFSGSGAASMVNFNALMRSVVGAADIMTLQSIIAPNIAYKISTWNPVENSTTPPPINAFTPFTMVGTATARSIAGTSLVTKSKRFGLVSSSAAGSLASYYQPTASFYTPSSILTKGAGGFIGKIRFACADAATVSGARQFVGFSASVSAPTNVEPSTLAGAIGIGHGASDTNLKFYCTGNTPIDLGSNFPVNTLSADLYEIIITTQSLSNIVNYTVNRLGTTFTASGSFSMSILSGNPFGVLMAVQAWRCNNATALAVGLDISDIYIASEGG